MRRRGAKVANKLGHLAQGANVSVETRLNGPTTLVNAIQRELAFRSKVIENTEEPKTIMKDGVWQVPPEKRPKWWERMGGRECLE